MNQKDVIKWVAVAGGAYALYWYLTNYGPNGAVSAGSVSWWNSWFGSGGASAGVLNGGVVPTIGADVMTAGELQSFILAEQGQGKSAAQIQTDLNNLAVLKAQCSSPAQWDATKAACVTTPAPGGNGTPGGSNTVSTVNPGLAAQLLRISGASPTQVYNADQWNYYFNSMPSAPLTPQQFGTAFPGMTATDRGPAMTVYAFVNALHAAGLDALGGGAPSGMSGIGAIVPVGSRPSIPSMSFGGAAAVANPSGFKKGWS